MSEILLLTLCAVICGAKSRDDIETFGKSTLDFLHQYLPYEHGIPSDDTLRRFFRAIDTTQFQRLFVEYPRRAHMRLPRFLICSDKPCIRGLRITVYDVLSWLAEGMSRDEMIEDFPELNSDDIIASLLFAADRERTG